MLRFLFVFFFQCYGDHRDLHSFPTRRSSDLDALPTGGVRSRSMLSHWLLTLPTGSRSSTQTCLSPSLPESVNVVGLTNVSTAPLNEVLVDRRMPTMPLASTAPAPTVTSTSNERVRAAPPSTSTVPAGMVGAMSSCLTVNDAAS